MKSTVTIPSEMAGLRLDQALAQLLPQYSRARLQAWIKKGYVTLDNQSLRARDKVKADQTLCLDAPPEIVSYQTAQALPLNIIYEDDSLIIINKPAGMVVHPGAGNPQHTLLNALLHHFPELAQLPRAGIIHRLDKETSGLLVIARTLAAHQYLIKAMQAHQIKREYKALVQGYLISGSRIEAAIGRHPTHRTHMAVTETGKPAVTHYRVLKKFPGFTLLKVQLETGRTHQIRVHLAHIRHPIVGDPVYGGRLKLPANISPTLKKTLQQFKRQALHAFQLQLVHPVTGKNLQWQAPMPEDMQKLLALLDKNK